MFPKPQRLPSIFVGIVVRQGKRLFQSGCEIRTSPTKAPVSRFAVIVPVSTHKRAVKRNYVKRCLRESVIHLADSIGKPYDIIIFGRKELVGKTQQEIEEILTEIFKKLG